MPQIRIKSLGSVKDEMVITVDQETFDKVMAYNLMDLLALLEQFLAADSGYRLDSMRGLQRLAVYKGEESPTVFSPHTPIGTINTRDLLWLWYAPFEQVASLVTSKVPEWKAIAITRVKFAA
jgi:hypothetical protein